MGVIGEQRDQGEEHGGKNRDPALTVKSNQHRSQPQPPTNQHLNRLGHQRTRGKPGNALGHWPTN